MEPVAFVLGVSLLALTAWDLFETVVVPRPTPGWFRIGRYVVRLSWRAIRAVRDLRPDRSFDGPLGLFAPAVTLALLATWLIGFIVGYGLVLYAIRDELRPVPPDLGSTLYFAASSVLTLGFGDIVPDGGAARLIVTISAISGLGTVALVVTFLFSLYGSYQRREVQVVALQAAAGAPPSAVTLLETYATLGLVDRLPDLFLDWQRWAAEVLDSHVAYPVLGYFRSSHDNLSWISAVGAMLDAASLVLTTIEDIPRGEAKLFKRVGTHLVEDIHNLGFRSGEQTRLDRSDFDAACDRLEEAGYTLQARDGAWTSFQTARGDLRPAPGGDGAVLGDSRHLVAGRSHRAPSAHPPRRRRVAARGRRLKPGAASGVPERAGCLSERSALARGRPVRPPRDDGADDQEHGTQEREDGLAAHAAAVDHAQPLADPDHADEDEHDRDDIASDDHRHGLRA